LFALGAIEAAESSCIGGNELHVVTAADFAAVDEPGSTAILGAPHAPLIGEGLDVMVYGDGGVGKTTLCVDLAYHLAAGDDWLGIPIPEARRVLLVENEGARPLFRRKLASKQAEWSGAPIGDRLLVLERPWGRFSFADSECCDELAETIHQHEIDVVFVGPVTASGMDEAGTMQEVRAFVALVDEVRARSGRPVAFVLVHHESKSGKVSGAWEGVGDTLLHVNGQGHGKLRLHVQKARWASDLHAKALRLVWADGDSFALAASEPSRPERTWQDIESFVLEHGGTGWNAVDKAVPGEAGYLRRRRDSMLEEGVLLNVGRGQAFELWHRDDPERPTLDRTASDLRRGSDAAASATGDRGEPNRVAASAP
jgi:hypothetical protein